MHINSARISGEYANFKRVLNRDYPYELDPEIFDTAVEQTFVEVYHDLSNQHAKTKNSFYSNTMGGIVNLAYLDHYLLICLRFSQAIVRNGLPVLLADAAYYSSRVRTSTDVYYRSSIGKHFLPSHPIGSVIDSRATYGIGFRLYNGVHIGPYGIADKPPSKWVHPQFGDGVIVYANAKIYGHTVVGNNVTISPGVSIVNERIPDNCIVFGATPELKVVPNRQNNMAIFDL